MFGEKWVKLTVNGELYDHGGDGMLSSLLSELGADPGHVVVMINGDVVVRKDYDATGLTEGDVVEVLVYAGGG